jgi:hypothetical protein
MNVTCARNLTTHSTGARISISFIVNSSLAALNARPVNSGVRLLSMAANLCHKSPVAGVYYRRRNAAHFAPAGSHLSIQTIGRNEHEETFLGDHTTPDYQH